MNAAVPLPPVVNVSPVVEASVRIPFETVSVSESLPLPALASVSVMALPLPVEKTSEEFSATVAVLGAVIVGGVGCVHAQRHAGRGRQAVARIGDRNRQRIGAGIARGRLINESGERRIEVETVPVTVNEDESLLPDVKVSPDVVDNVNVPCETDSVSESALVPALASVTLMAFPLADEKVNEPFSAKLADAGALTLGGCVVPYPARAGTSRLAIGVPSPVTRS